MKRFLKSINGKISILIIIMTVFTLTSLILSGPMSRFSTS